MESFRKEGTHTQEQSSTWKQNQIKNDTWLNSKREEQQYRVVSDDTSIYEFDLHCMKEKTEWNE